MRITYEQVKVSVSKTARCPLCGRRRRLNRTFVETVNPYNKRPDGTVRTRQEIRSGLERKAQRWRTVLDEPHDRCQLAKAATS